MENSKARRIKRIQIALIVIFVAADLALVVANYLMDLRNAEARWIGSYPMANQNITWEGAGYQQYGEAANR